MFRGGDYYDDPKFNNQMNARNNMDVSVSRRPNSNK